MMDMMVAMQKDMQEMKMKLNVGHAVNTDEQTALLTSAAEGGFVSA